MCVAMVGCCVHTLVLRDREFVWVSAKTDSSASLHVGYTNLWHSSEVSQPFSSCPGQ